VFKYDPRQTRGRGEEMKTPEQILEEWMQSFGEVEDYYLEDKDYLNLIRLAQAEERKRFKNLVMNFEKIFLKTQSDSRDFTRGFKEAITGTLEIAEEIEKGVGGEVTMPLTHQVEEYLKGTDYAAILAERFKREEALPCILLKGRQQFKAVRFLDHDFYTWETHYSYMCASAAWLRSHGYTINYLLKRKKK
jgi:hypothetical protein